MDPTRRPWYMKGGARRPFPAIKARSTGRRLAQLWPEENIYDDRVTNQVMIVEIVLELAKLNINSKLTIAYSTLRTNITGCFVKLFVFNLHKR